MRTVDADGSFVDQVRPERMNVSHGRTRRRNVIAVRELAPPVTQRAENGAVARLILIILQQADEHRVLRRDVVVHAQDLIFARLCIGALELEVVLPLAGRIGEVRQRKTVQKRKADAADAAWRYFVTGKTTSRAAGGTRAARVWIPNQDGSSIGIYRLCEIAGAFQCGR